MAGLIQLNGGGDYASLNAAVAAATGADAITISGDWAGDDTTDVTWDQPCTVRISGDSLNKVGKPGRAAGSYRLVKANAGADHVFTVTADVDIWDMDIMSDSSGASDEIFRVGNNEVDITCKRCHIGFSGNTDQQDVLYYGDSSNHTVAFTFESCMFYDIGRSIVDIFDADTTSITVNFNGCSSLNIGANGARANGSWFGSEDGNGSTETVNAFNNLMSCDDDAGIVGGVNNTVTVNVDYNTTNLANEAALVVNEDTLNATANRYAYTWTDDADPGAGNKVGLRDITVSPYDQRLTDHANNDAIDVHSVETGPDSGLAIANDIIGTVRGAAENHDVGAFEIAAAPGGVAPTAALQGPLFGPLGGPI